MENERKPGRPRSEKAHRAIIEATHRLLNRMPIRDITIEGIAREAGVGKPTIYRWWDGKCALVMEAFLDSIPPQVPFPEAGSAVEVLKEQVEQVVKLMRGRPGKIVAEMIGEGQSDPHVLEKLRKLFFSNLLQPARQAIEWGKQKGELDQDLDTDFALDMIYGPIYYRLLVGHKPLDDAFTKAIPARVISAIKGSPDL